MLLFILPFLLVGSVAVRHNELIFVKTHKTGGSTVSSILHRYCDEHRGVTCYTVGPIQHNADVLLKGKSWLERAQLPRVNIYTYHTRYWPKLLHAYVPEPAPVITIVRDPVARFLSGWDYKPKSWRGRSDIINIVREMPDDVNKLPQDFNKLLHANCVQQELCPDAPSWAISNVSEPTCLQTLRDMRSGKLALVMITEHMDESLVLLGRMMGWELRELLYLSMKNSSRDHDHPPSDVATKIRHWLSEDMRVYEEALRLFKARIASETADFHLELLRFKQMKLDAHMDCSGLRLNGNRVVDECSCRLMRLDHADWVRKHMTRGKMTTGRGWNSVLQSKACKPPF